MVGLACQELQRYHGAAARPAPRGEAPDARSLLSRAAASHAARRRRRGRARRASRGVMKAAKQPAAGSEPDTASRMTAAEAAVAALVAHGIDTVYALPGVHNDHLFDALFKAGEAIRTIHTRHEQGAAY